MAGGLGGDDDIDSGDDDEEEGDGQEDELDAVLDLVRFCYYLLLL